MEEVLEQHPQLNILNPNCINTVRVATYTDRDDVHIVLATIRSARDDSVVDNYHAGGICMAVDLETGKICSNGHRRADARLSHPSPHWARNWTAFSSPTWDKALDVIRRASREMYALPGCRYLGWDIAFMKNGEVSIIECNWRQGPQAQQPRTPKACITNWRRWAEALSHAARGGRKARKKIARTQNASGDPRALTKPTNAKIALIK